MERFLSVAGLANARDLGGLKRMDGSVTPTGAFIRAEMLDRLDESGWEYLWSYGVRTVIDLRRPSERSGVVPAGIELVCVDLDGDEPLFWKAVEADGRWGTPLYYAAHVRELPDRLAEVLETIAAANEGTVLFHCGAGWDRTGLVAAILLRALGVTAAAAAGDYLASFANADAMASLHGRSFDVEERLEVLARFGHSPESAFIDMYDELDLENWFQLASIDGATRTAIGSWRGAVKQTS